ncbi:MAG: ribosome rescue protein RqcH [Thermoproteota archaeon]
MKTPKISLSSFDYLILARELYNELNGAWVDNVYHNPEYGYYLLKFRIGGVVKKLVVMPGESIFLTDYDYPVPNTPSQGLTRLRKTLCNLRVEDIKQHDFDRIMVMSLSRGGFNARLIMEGLKRGVLVLVSEDGHILFTSQRIEMGARSIREGEKYVFPPSNIVDPRGVLETLEEFSSEKLDRFIAGRLGLGSKIMSEICRRSGLDPDSKVGEKLPIIMETVRMLIREAEEKPSPRIYYSNDSPVDVSGIRLLSLEGLRQREFKSLSEALDAYYSSTGFEAEGGEVKSLTELTRLLKVKENLASEVEKLRIKAQTVMDNITDFQSFLDSVKKGKGFSGGISILEVDYSKRNAKALFKDLEFTLNMDVSAAANASSMFEEAKKIEKHLSEIDSRILLLEKKASLKREKMIPEKKSVERKWYEKFRWNTSINGNLILAGKDAGTNELLIKKHVTDKSIVLHADYTGAPFVTIYNVETPSEEELEEAALMAACYATKAWENKYASLDVYWVRGSQVSKQAPPGQYLSKGAFMIHGEKNFIRDVELKLWVGLTDDGEIVYGALRKVRAKCRRYALIAPGDRDKDKEAAKLAAKILKDADLPRRELSKLRESVRSIIPGRHCETRYMPSTSLD